MPLIRSIYLTNRFFYAVTAIILLFVLSYLWNPIYGVINVLLGLFALLTLTDILLMFWPGTYFEASRSFAPKLSLSDRNNISLEVRSHHVVPLNVEFIDELPFQLQKRDMSLNFSLAKREKKNLVYTIRPTERGEYQFGRLLFFISGKIGLIQRRVAVEAFDKAAVFPSIIQMKKYELLAISSIAHSYGVKKIRRIGHSYEFEQIKQYARGDDYRSINWKATGRRARLMVNQYTDEKSQSVYSIIDKSRVMKMPFNGLTLLDYAINTSLAIGNIVLRKGDKYGMVTFSDKIGSVVKADSKPNQLRSILEALYRQRTRFPEADYELLYHTMRRSIRQRSLLLFYTNFESRLSLRRNLKILRQLNKRHLLVVIFFENEELTEYAEQACRNTRDVYLKTIARSYQDEKKSLKDELQNFGIQCIITRPQDLSVNTINKYLEVKAGGMI